MSFSLPYLIGRFFYRIKEFFRHWYISSFFVISRQTINFLERLDRILALKITLRNVFSPLYQDYTLLGYLLGFFFRFWRILIAASIYLVVILIALLIYLGWAAVPIYIFYRGIWLKN